MNNYKAELDKIKKVLRSKPRGMSVTDISRELELSRNTVAKYLEMLRVSGYVDMEAIGTAKIYCLSQRIPTSSLLNFSSDFILVTDSNLIAIQANKNFLELLDLTKDQVIGKKIDYKLFPVAAKTGLVENLKTAIEGNEYTGKVQVEIKGREYYFNCKIIPSTFDDGEQGATLIFDDITESMNDHYCLVKDRDQLEKMILERTEELEKLNDSLKVEIAERKKVEMLLQKEKIRMQTYLDVVGVILIVLDNEGNCSLINKKGAALLGINEEDVIGKNWLDEFIPENYRDEVRSIFNGVKKGLRGYPGYYEN
ncbi:PAS domain S-box protein [Methanolobus sp. ZRKC3]|uniref:PAS domain-containing protein n=1 Tax=Methanolobus sp. ZRKC3 TaxID=3125786 RepID=UPI00324A82CA